MLSSTRCSLWKVILILVTTACAINRSSPVVPPDLALEINRKFALKVEDVVSEKDLSQDDRKLFKLARVNRSSPGFAELDCCGDSRPAIFLLIRDREEKAFFLIAGRVGSDSSWQVEKLERVDGDVAPVIQIRPPGQYHPVNYDTDESSIVILKRPAVALIGFESWEILFWWDGSAFRRAWLSD